MQAKALLALNIAKEMFDQAEETDKALLLSQQQHLPKKNNGKSANGGDDDNSSFFKKKKKPQSNNSTSSALRDKKNGEPTNDHGRHDRDISASLPVSHPPSHGSSGSSGGNNKVPEKIVLAARRAAYHAVRKNFSDPIKQRTFD